MLTNLTKQMLIEQLSYEAATGVFTWRHRKGSRSAGAIAGARDAHGYIVIRINGKLYKAHRLAWLYEYGEWPCSLIDHINRKRDDNRIANLRDVSQTINMHNANARKLSLSGVPGVRYRKDKDRWIATIKISYTQHYLGSFKTKAEAARARAAAETQMANAIRKPY